MHDPPEPYFHAMKRILCYIKGTLHYGLRLNSSAASSLVSYPDADWEGVPIHVDLLLETVYF